MNSSTRDRFLTAPKPIKETIEAIQYLSDFWAGTQGSFKKPKIY